MALTAAAHEAMLDHLASLVDNVSAHTAAPNASGSNEVTGGSYARQAITFNSAATENLDSSNTPVIPIPGGTTVTHVGLWDAATFLGSIALGSPETFASDGTLTVADLDIAAAAA